MPEIPKRLIVIQARIPTGESCFENGQRCELLDASERCGISGEDTDSYRLPACRERDGWAAFPPGSGVPELVEAALNWLNAPISGVQLDDVDARLAGAARKVKK
jgi:hypothetical protein